MDSDPPQKKLQNSEEQGTPVESHFPRRRGRPKSEGPRRKLETNGDLADPQPIANNCEPETARNAREIVRVKVPLTSAERRLVKIAASLIGLPVSAYIRDAAVLAAKADFKRVAKELEEGC